MKTFCFGLLCSALLGAATAAVSIPSTLVGIWAVENSEFDGDALTKGQALYLNANGYGRSVGGNGKLVIGINLEIASFDRKTNELSFGMMENDVIVGYRKAVYDPKQKVILYSDQRYTRRSERLSPELKQSLTPATQSK